MSVHHGFHRAHSVLDSALQVSSSQATEKNDTGAGQGDGNHLIVKRDLALSEGDVHTLVSAIASTRWQGHFTDVTAALMPKNFSKITAAELTKKNCIYFYTIQSSYLPFSDSN